MWLFDNGFKFSISEPNHDINDFMRIFTFQIAVNTSTLYWHVRHIWWCINAQIARSRFFYDTIFIEYVKISSSLFFNSLYYTDQM